MRKSGILMHITSLPNAYGIGTMGKCAYDFVDFLVQAGQSYWQILPLSPTGYGDSPYQAFSTFAGNHYLIDLDLLVQEGLLQTQEIQSLDWGADPEHVDFGRMYALRSQVLQLAYGRFSDWQALKQFVAENAHWLEDYGLFMALKARFHGKDWQSWSVSLMMRYAPVLDSYRAELENEIQFQYFLQYTFFKQWKALRSYANEKGVRIIGDVPIYVPLDSADVWANPKLFLLDQSRRPELVAGCPPDSFSADGQRWGNPIYDWAEMKRTGYDWWLRRLQAAAEMYDVVRLDHFRGFESYWAIPAREQTAIRGHWCQGPGMDFIHAVRRTFPELPFIAEDLGFVTPQVRKLQEDSGYPGMKILQFAFDSREAGDYMPHSYKENSVCYSGTHDNLTLKQWLCEAAQADVEKAKQYLGLNQEEGYVWGMLRGCMSSVSKLCIIQLQDYLELDGQARMNCPGVLSEKNWTWRLKAGVLNSQLAQRICTLTKRYERI